MNSILVIVAAAFIIVCCAAPPEAANQREWRDNFIDSSCERCPQCCVFVPVNENNLYGPWKEVFEPPCKEDGKC